MNGANKFMNAFGLVIATFINIVAGSVAVGWNGRGGTPWPPPVAVERSRKDSGRQNGGGGHGVPPLQWLHRGALLQTQSLELKGEVKDQQGAVIIGAKVTLLREGAVTRVTVTDGEGRFAFSKLPGGSYTLSVTAEGFTAFEEVQELRDRVMPEKILITLYAGTINEKVTVDSAVEINMDPARAAGTQVLTQREIEALPDDPDRLREQLQTLAASSGSVPGDATVTVDGFLTGGSLPPKSAIREVRINPDLYSAEYDTPPYRGGRVEILTKPGAEAFRGSAFFNLNNSRLNARDPFALERAATNTRRYGFQLGGPIIRKRAGFFLDLERRDIDEAATVNAFVLNDAFQIASFGANVLTPARLTIGSARFDWQPNAQHTLIARFDLNRNALVNQNAGGFNLPERAINSDLTEYSVRLTETAVLSPSTLNELRFGLTWLQRDELAVAGGPGIVVPGAFAAGGATLQRLARAERRLEITDTLSTVHGKHNLKLGLQLHNRDIEDERAENTAGTFFFGGTLAPSLNGPDLTPVFISGLEQYRRTLIGLPGGVPTQFTITQGAPGVAVNQWLLAAFVQDEWRLRSNMSLNLGLRYEAQTAPADAFSVAPRLGITYSPDKNQRWILRARAGLFYERIADALTLDVLRQDGVQQRQLVINSPSFPNPFDSAIEIQTISTIRRLAGTLRPATSLQMGLEVERMLPRGWKISARQSWTRGWADIRSRNINAPILQIGEEPPNGLRPMDLPQDILQFESSGRTTGRVFFIGLFQSTNKTFSIASGYLHFNFRTNADRAYMLPQSSYSDEGEWARPFWQASHRVFLSSNINLPMKLRANLSLNAASGTPFNITSGRDNNGDGAFNDRPNLVRLDNANAIITRYGALDPTAINGNLPRNAGTNPGNVTLDLNLSRRFALGSGANGSESRFQLTATAAAYNVLNRTNLRGLNGVLASPFFGRANAAAPARRIEFGLRFNF